MKIRSFLILLFILFVFNSILVRQCVSSILPRNHRSSLSNNGYVLLQNVFTDNDLHMMRTHMESLDHETLKTFVVNHDLLTYRLLQHIYPAHISKDYQFQDYILLINKSQIHTCHRDYNATLYQKLRHPSFTLIIYLYDMESCLDVIENSHKSISILPYLTDVTKHILCNPGDVLFFDSGLVHAGSLINKSQNNPRIQMKFCHKDDRKHLSFYEKYTKIIDDDNKNSDTFNHVIKHTTCQYPYLSDISTQITNGKNFKPPKLFNNLIYGNSAFF